MKFGDFKIGTRLYIAFGAVVLLFLIVISSVFINFSRVGDANKLNIHTYEVAGQLDALLASLVNTETGERGFALTGNESSLEPYKNGLRTFDQHIASAKQLTSDNSAQQQRLQKLIDLQKHWVSDALEPVITARRQAGQNMEQIANVIVMEQGGKGKADMDAMRVILTEAKSNELSLLSERAEDLARLQSTTAMTIYIGGALATLLALITSIGLTKSIARPLNRAVTIAETVAAGDLRSDIQVGSKDETGQLMAALKTMNNGLLNIVSQVRIGTEVIATASQQIAGGNLDLSSRTEQQATS